MEKNMKITMAHGSGGRSSAELMSEIFGRHFKNHILDRMEDAAVLELASSAGGTRIACSTDSFTVILPLLRTLKPLDWLFVRVIPFYDGGRYLSTRNRPLPPAANKMKSRLMKGRLFIASAKYSGGNQTHRVFSCVSFSLRTPAPSGLRYAGGVSARESLLPRFSARRRAGKAART